MDKNLTGGDVNEEIYTVQENKLSPYKSLHLYFKSSVDIVKANPMLIIIPLVFVIGGRIINYIQNFSYYSSAWGAFTTRFMAGNRPVNLSYILNRVFTGVFNSLGSLHYGLTGAIMGSSFYLVVFFLAIISFKWLSKSLSPFAHKDDIKNIHFIEKILLISLIGTVGSILLVYAFYLSQLAVPALIVGTFAFVFISLFAMMPLTLIEGFLLCGVKSLIMGEKLHSEKSIGETVRITPRLFKLNLVLVILASIPAYSNIPLTLAGFFSGTNISFYTPILKAARFYAMFLPIITASLVFTPFVALDENSGVMEILKKNFEFIKKTTPKSLILIGVGAGTMAVPDILLMFSGTFLSGLTGIIPSLILLSIKTAAGVVVYVALMEFWEREKQGTGSSEQLAVNS